VQHQQHIIFNSTVWGVQVGKGYIHVLGSLITA